MPKEMCSINSCDVESIVCNKVFYVNSIFVGDKEEITYTVIYSLVHGEHNDTNFEPHSNNAFKC